MEIEFVFELYGYHRDLHVLTHSFPTRRSSCLAFAARGNPRQLALETRLALVDDIAVPARLHEGDAPGVEKLVGNAGTAVAHAWLLPKRLHSVMRPETASWVMRPGAWPPPGTPAGRARPCRRWRSGRRGSAAASAARCPA